MQENYARPRSHGNVAARRLAASQPPDGRRVARNCPVAIRDRFDED
jgi:hypothetical protein